MDVLQILCDGCQTAGIEDGAAENLVHVVAYPFIYMAQRQEAQDASTRVVGVHHRHRMGVDDHALVTQHHPFGLARGTRGVNQRADVLRRGVLFDFLDDRFPLFDVGAADFQQLAEIAAAFDLCNGENLRLLLYVGDGRLHPSVNLLHPDDDDLRIAVVQDVTVVVFVEGGIHRHVDAARHRDAHVQEVPFRTVLHDGGYLVAFLQAHLQQCGGDGVGMFYIFVDGVFAPMAVGFATGKHFLIAILFQMV